METPVEPAVREKLNAAVDALGAYHRARVALSRPDSKDEEPPDRELRTVAALACQDLREALKGHARLRSPDTTFLDAVALAAFQVDLIRYEPQSPDRLVLWITHWCVVSAGLVLPMYRRGEVAEQLREDAAAHPEHAAARIAAVTVVLADDGWTDRLDVPSFCLQLRDYEAARATTDSVEEHMQRFALGYENRAQAIVAYERGRAAS